MDYELYITPLDETGRAYGTRVDVTQDYDASEFLTQGGISPIRQEVDQGDFDIGVFNYAELKISLNNTSGKFNEPYLDSRSIFPSIRDRALIELYYIDSAGASTLAYEGLLADRATTINLSTGRISFSVLGLDSIFSQNVVYSGSIPDGTFFSDAFRIILDIPEITDILTFSAANINPTLDLEIDDGSKFDNLTVKAALDQLLFASASVLYIDNSRNIIVRDRTPNATTPINFYMNHPYQDDNYYNLTGFNNGLQRLFNVIVVNGYASKDQTSIDIYRTRLKSFAAAFITDVDNKKLIGEAYIDEFAYPRDEFFIVTDSETAKSVIMFDKAVVYYGLIDKKYRGHDPGIYEADEYESAYYSNPVGQIELTTNVIYKVMGIFKNPGNDFTVTLKLRKTTDYA